MPRVTLISQDTAIERMGNLPARPASDATEQDLKRYRQSLYNERKKMLRIAMENKMAIHKMPHTSGVKYRADQVERLITQSQLAA